MTRHVANLTRDTASRYEYTDLDGDTIRVTPINSIKVNQAGPSVYLQTTEPGVFIPVADVEAFIAAVRSTAALITERAARTPAPTT
jgi:hypothetical protein